MGVFFFGFSNVCHEARPLVSDKPILIKRFFGPLLLEFEYVGK